MTESSKPEWVEHFLGTCARIIAKHNGGTLDGYTMSRVEEIYHEAKKIVPSRTRKYLLDDEVCFCGHGQCDCATEVIVEYDIQHLESVLNVLMDVIDGAPAKPFG